MTKLSRLVAGMREGKKVIFREAGGRFSVNPIDSPAGTHYEVIIRPTMLCNINCRHCFLSRSNTSYEAGSIEKMLTILSEVADKINLTFSGGEPTLYRGFSNTIQKAIDDGFSAVTVQTNGIMFSSEVMASSIAESQNISFFASFLSHKEETYEILTRSKSYEKAISGLKKLSREHSITLNHVIMKQNYKEFPDLIRFVADNFNLDNTKVLISNIGTPSDGKHHEFFMRYSDLTPVFREAFAIAEKLGVNLEFTVSGDCSYPLCFYHRIDPKILDAGMFYADDSKISYESLDNKFYKSSGCKRCKYDKNCQGFFSEYIRYFGDSEVRPISGENDNSVTKSSYKNKQKNHTVNDSSFMRNMSVAMIVNHFPCLSETFIFSQITGLIDRGVDVDIFAFSADDSVAYPKNEEYRLDDRTHYCNTKDMDELLEKFNGKAPKDILHCHFGPNGIPGIELKRKKLVKKLIVSFYGYDLSKNLCSKDNQEEYKSLFKEVDILLPLSQLWADLLIKMGAPREKVMVHRLGVDTKFFSPTKSKSNTERLRITTTARLVEKKGIKYAIKALAAVRKDFPDLDIKYDVIGDGPLYSELSHLIDSFDLSNIVSLHGALTNFDVRKILSESDIFVLPSVTASDGDTEGTPVSLIEAMSSAIPVISTLHSGIPELVENGVSGFLIPERDVVALSDIIVYLAHNRHLLSELGAEGRKKVIKNHDIETLNDKLLNIYESILT